MKRAIISEEACGFGLSLSLLAACLLFSTVPAKAEYHLQPGDVIEVSVAGIPELRQRAAVQLDGTISVPLVGALTVAQLSLPEVRARIQSAMASKVFRLRLATGQEVAVTIERDEVSAAIAEYRPIYVSGDVANPGEKAYRPSMIVRQALAAASGLQPVPVQANFRSLDPSSLKSEYTSTWLELAKEQARIGRIRAELGEEVRSGGTDLPPAPVAQAAAAEISSLEADYSDSRQDDYEREKQFLLKDMKIAEEQSKILAEQQQKEAQGVQADLLDLEKAVELLNKGSLTNTRVTEARRAVLLSATRKLQTDAELMHVNRQRNEILRKLEKLGDQRRLDLLRDLQDGTVRVGSLRAKLQSIQEKLQMSGMMPPIASEADAKLEITIRRRGSNGWQRLDADEDTELLPGDIIEVVRHFS